MAVISFKPKQITKGFLLSVPDRARNVLIQRFGLGDDAERVTLEAIGKDYGITRERVRQIENFALKSVKKSDAFSKGEVAFRELEDLVVSLGGVVAEDDLLAHISTDKSVQNHVALLLILGNSFERRKEDDHFKHRWIVDPDVAEKVHESLVKLHGSLSNNDIISESEIIDALLKHLKGISERYKNEEIVKRWLTLSKVIGRNPLGEWGIATSPHINTRGMRDYAFLVIRRHGSPMHFTEVAAAINDVFGKPAHVATCHNELIKDNRFVLVGRGLYALSEWGYESGVVRDVIRKILDKYGPMTKEEVIEKVLKERYVKENTVTVNLQDTRAFVKDKNGKYIII
ncbi:MAG: hypothetical protein COZ49_02095 [Candidatus Yonathbacteria bacterium CG_4_10_14_3_um_filter_47_65]|uniref:RNA polymerase sigma-70 region 4 domain-containing protein n=2 Tax=Parcubacteria group TaxID=1794811 RepID=A0A2M8D5U7_9BACT|nr:MAG: hypothetical protein AUJ44_02015 [Candidatus Nomurabacteria bacterium CG1_02_47_685]PIP03253.1 MAG: hypothetical protein COX54_04400 [Candidatus Yonathbacteria bacterium CG23_combo_of_CG06-09_8_20_14_all_46_18]PIQ32141.1 MAG: hypothetical protein COW61_02280 [Candidatus Yonathbacteria bacterium CG17_big_fil_post_rev_8_21_14_2_50_46_19]PIX56446.1 MAG: hypothetical protein COZ49_02095 [Candidatus Yonathbacteria bacterium CG_4_10_14_3_um_filter_47_65]PIY57730.1 MAG: hypothetical protein CO